MSTLRLSILAALVLIPAHALAQQCADPIQLSRGPFFGEAGTWVTDMNHDGRPDVLIATHDAVFPGETSFAFQVRYGRPAPQYFDSTIHLLGTYATPPSVGRTFIADVDNDRLPDIVLVESDKVYVRRNLGIALDVAMPWTTDRFDGDRFFVADIDNDGQADLISTTFTGIHIRRSTGSAFAEDEAFKNMAGSYIRFFVDVTGDGRADAIAIDPYGIYVARFIADAFEDFYLWGVSGPDPDKLYFADVTGDGRRDAISIDGGQISVRPNYFGSGFEAPARWLAQGQLAGTVTTAFADFIDIAGPRAADLIMVNTNGILGRASDGRQFVVGPCF